MVFIASCTAPCSVGCWCSMESAIQPLAVPQPVSQPNHMVYNPHYGQQMQYQNNASYPYNPHQPQMPAQQIPVQHMPAQQIAAHNMPVQHMPVQHMPAQPMPVKHTPIDTTAQTVTETSVNTSPAYPVGSAEDPKPTETEQKAIAPENEQNSETIAIEPEPGIEGHGKVLDEDTSGTNMEA